MGLCAAEPFRKSMNAQQADGDDGGRGTGTGDGDAPASLQGEMEMTGDGDAPATCCKATRKQRKRKLSKTRVDITTPNIQALHASHINKNSEQKPMRYNEELPYTW